MCPVTLNRYRRLLITHAALLALVGASACGDDDAPNPRMPDASVPGTGADAAASTDAGASTDGGADTSDAGPQIVEWPAIESAIALDPDIEEAVASLVAQMSVAQKVGQMVQAEINDDADGLSPEDVKQYHLGSVLNGGGSWPGRVKAAPLGDWVALADAYYDASMDTVGDTDDQYLAIPILWGTDAVHGHNNVMGATIFPHNIGLGATNDPELIERIGLATAREVAATGIDWTFAPTLAVVRDDRWGRSYEAYSEDPEIVRDYGGRMVIGLQGANKGGASLFDDDRVIATAKHFIADGGTDKGKDQGDNLGSEAELLHIHAQGYLTALAAGAQTVMASFSSWRGTKMHGHRYLLTDVLRGKLGFDGFVVGDWNGHGQLPGCDNGQCADAINAGVDMIMVPNDWKAFIANTIQQVEDGEIAMARIDEAVTRILRVKMRAGLLGPKTSKGKPSTRELAGDTSVLASSEHRALAREAVRKSLVLLKNQEGLLPLDKDLNIFVAGKNADNIGNQSGGWTLTWQGTENVNEDFPHGDSIYDGIVAAITDAASGGTVTLSQQRGDDASDDFDVAIVVIGETPYSEGQGDIGAFATLEHARQSPDDLAVMQAIRERAPNLPIVTVFVSGRPLHVNKELNLSDAFVAAWLPGSEGAGVADVLFGEHEFSGKLSFSWPSADCQTPYNRLPNDYPGDSAPSDSAPSDDSDGQALFAYGFGLTTTDVDTLGDDLPELSSDRGCDAPPPATGTTNEPIEIFTGGSNRDAYKLRIGGEPNQWGGIDVGLETALDGEQVQVSTVDGRIQGSAKLVTWDGIGQVYAQVADVVPGIDLGVYANSQTSLTFRVRVDDLDADAVNLAVHCEYPCGAELPLVGVLSSVADGQWHELQVPLQCFLDAGLDITRVNTPFLIFANGRMSLAIEDVRWQPMTAPESPDCTVYRNPSPSLNAGNTGDTVHTPNARDFIHTID